MRSDRRHLWVRWSVIARARQHKHNCWRHCVHLSFPEAARNLRLWDVLCPWSGHYLAHHHFKAGSECVFHPFHQWALPTSPLVPLRCVGYSKSIFLGGDCQAHIWIQVHFSISVVFQICFVPRWACAQLVLRLTWLLCRSVGGIMGFALVYEGTNGVTWAVRDPGAFPPYKVSPWKCLKEKPPEKMPGKELSCHSRTKIFLFRKNILSIRVCVGTVLVLRWFYCK